MLHQYTPLSDVLTAYITRHLLTVASCEVEIVKADTLKVFSIVI